MRVAETVVVGAMAGRAAAIAADRRLDVSQPTLWLPVQFSLPAGGLEAHVQPKHDAFSGHPGGLSGLFLVPEQGTLKQHVTIGAYNQP